MRNLKQSAAANVMVLMVDGSDHVSGKAGLALTVAASKDGAAFAAIAPAVADRGNGWYNLALTPAHLDTLGDLALHVTAAAADASDVLCRVVAGSLDADVSTRMGSADYVAPDNVSIGAIRSRTSNLPDDPASGTQVLTRLPSSAYTPAPTAAEVRNALAATILPVDLRKVNGQAIDGSGTEDDPWGPV